jgi:leader peptidase (prepilin peptidase)/N-methyltransferase
MGDVKLLGALGLFLGPYVLVALFFGSLLGIVAGIAAASRGGSLADTKIPFGPWLSAGAVLAAIFGPAALGWYLHIIGVL